MKTIFTFLATLLIVTHGMSQESEEAAFLML